MITIQIVKVEENLFFLFFLTTNQVYINHKYSKDCLLFLYEHFLPNTIPCGSHWYIIALLLHPSTNEEQIFSLFSERPYYVLSYKITFCVKLLSLELCCWILPQQQMLNISWYFFSMMMKSHPTETCSPVTAFFIISLVQL